MKFFALFAIFALVIATVVCEHELDPRCPQDESEESPAVFIAHESDCTKYYAVSILNQFLVMELDFLTAHFNFYHYL